MLNLFSGLVIVAGNYGSGKTEIVINLALLHKARGVAVRVADLDLVNPYFRTRAARNLLESHQIDIVLPPDGLLDADLPVLDRSIGGMIANPDLLTFLDIGGNDVGARVLGALGDHFKTPAVQMLLVINPMRPATATVAGCLDMRLRIERTAHLAVTGLIGNAHLMELTEAGHIYGGGTFCSAVAEAARLPLVFITAPAALAAELDPARLPCPVLAVERRLTMPWSA